jgi:hypothetical protein
VQKLDGLLKDYSAWSAICDPDTEADMFDASLLEEPRDIGLSVGR